MQAKEILVLPETLWVTWSNWPRLQIESAAEKIDRRLKMILVAVPTRLSLDAHDLAEKWLSSFEHVCPFLKWNLRSSYTATLTGDIRSA